MLRVLYEGTPQGQIPVQPFNSGSPVYWEAGAVGMLDANGQGVVSDGTAAYGILADRRSPYPGISIATFLPTSTTYNPNYTGGYGDESLFNQPGHGNSLFGTTAGINNIIPTNTVPTTTNLRDETGVNPNSDSRLVTMYVRGGIYGTDQFDTAQTYSAGQKLYVMTDSTGRLTNQSQALGQVATCIQPNDGNGFLIFKWEKN